MAGMYIVPTFTLPQALGGLIHVYLSNILRADEIRITTIASGFILGDGIFSIVSMILGALNVPHL